MTMRTTWKELQTGLEITTGHHYVITVHGPHIDAFRTVDLTFHSESAVVLPALSGALAKEPQAQLSSLATLAQVLAHADQTSDVLLVVGHTDTAGRRNSNLDLSAQRCKSALYLLRGDRNPWAELAHAHHTAEDAPHILRWAAIRHGFTCDPTHFSRENNPVQRALDMFRSEYRAHVDSEFVAEGDLSTADWAAFFELYQTTIAGALDLDDGGLDARRGALKFADPAFLACGEHWPIDGSGKDDVASRENRRVEFLFVAKDEVSKIVESDPPGMPVYEKPSRYHIRYRTTFSVSSLDPSQTDR